MAMRPIPSRKIRELFKAAEAHVERLAAILEHHPRVGYENIVWGGWEMEKTGTSSVGGGASAPVSVSVVPVNVKLDGRIAREHEIDADGGFYVRVYTIENDSKELVNHEHEGTTL